MELRAFAEQVLHSSSLDEKLRRPDTKFTDERPGAAVRVTKPTRPDNLQFAPRRTAPAMPKPPSFREEIHRATAHHIMANHELQALEVMAMVLLNFPAAPKEFRIGLAEIMLDEQRHTRLHAKRAADLGTPFGSLPVNSYIWVKATEYASVLEYVAGLPLVFEGANLDHTIEFRDAFLKHGDQRGADIMTAIHKDEIGHVEFGINWLRKMKPAGMTDFEAWQQSLHWPIRPLHAKGGNFQRNARLEAGLSPEFLDALEEWADEDSRQG